MKPRRQFNPFPGLRPFRMDEKHLFFGREEQTDELLLRLRDHRFLAVVGTSGSGKSSLVRAGLLPELHGGSMLEAGFQWEVVVMRPGGDPFSQLAEALVANDLYDPDRESVVPETRATLSRSGYGLVEAIRQSDIETGSSLLLVVDQFEELFRFRGSSAAHLEEAGDFVELLLRAVEQNEVPIYVALTMRSDYLGNCAEFPGLAEAVNEGEYLIPRLTREQRRSVIEGPVRVGGGTISSRLLQALLNEVGDDPDHLPVLQHALMRTWEYWEHDHADDEPIDLRHYENVGGMAEALSRHADEVYDELPDDRHRAVAEKLFKSLTERSGSNPGIRRPGTLRKLGEVAETDKATLVTIIDAFRKLGRTFLMPVEGVELQPDTVIDISHESLMRVWKRLAGWVEEESQSARIYGRLRETAALHARGRAGLYHDPDLQIAESWKESAEPNQAWAEQYGGRFEEASAFLDASREAARQVEREKEAARLREVEQATKLADTQARAARHFRRFAFGMAGVAVVALMAFGIALNARRQAISARQEALHQEHLAKIQEYSANLRAATAFLNDEEGKQAALLALDASAPSSSDEDDLRGWEWSHLQLHADQTAGGIEGLKPLHFAEYSPNGRYLVTAETGIIYKVWEAKDLFPESESERGAVGRPGGRLWNASLHEKRPLHELHVPQTPDWTVGPDNLLKPQFSPDSSQLIVADDHGVILWDLSTGEHRLLQGPQAKGLHVNEQGTILGAADPDEDGATTQIWNYTNNHLLALLQPTPEIKVSDCAFSPDGSLVATSYSTGRLDRTKEREIWLWDVESGEKKEVLRGINGSVSGMTFWQSPDGRETRLMASTAGSAMALQWDVATFPAKELTPYRCIKNWMLCATYRSDGQAVATSDGYGIRVYPDTGPPFSLYGHRSSTRTVRFHPSGKHLVSAGDDGTVRFWHANDVPFSRGEPLLLRGDRMWGGGVSFSPDGTKLASCEADDSAIRIWDTMTGREERFLTNDGVVWTIQYHPTNGNRLVSSGDGSAKVRIWELDAGTSTPLLGPTHLMRVAVFSPDGARIAAAGAGEDLFVWNALTGQLEKRIKIHEDVQSTNWGVSFSPDGKTIATCSIDASSLVKIWDVESGRLTQVLDSGSPQPLYWVSFNPNGGQVAVASASNDVLIWDLPHPQPRRLKGHRERAISLVYAPDGKRLFSGSYDDHVRVWDVATGRELYSLSANCADVFVLALDPKGKTLAVSGAFGLEVYEAERPPAEVLRERATVREALRILEQPSLKDLPLAEEIVDALNRDDNLDDASREVATQIARNRGDNVMAFEERKQLDEEIAQALAADPVDRDQLVKLRGERFRLRSSIHLGLDTTAPDDWAFLRTEVVRSSSTDELLSIYMERLVAEGKRLQNSGKPQDARRAFALAHVYQTLRTSETNDLEIRMTIEDEEPLEALLRPEQAPQSLWVRPGSDTVWKYWDLGIAPEAGWTGSPFDDSAWLEGPASLGYDRLGEETFTTTLSDTIAEHLKKASGENRNLRACFFRHEFSLSPEDMNALESRSVLQINLWRDDGAVVYLNGQEVLRDAMPSGPLTADTHAHSNAAEAGGKALLRRHQIPSSALKAGRNVIAAQVHQVSTGSTDLAFDLSMGPEPSLFAEAGEGISQAELDVSLDALEAILPLAYREEWMANARFAFLKHEEALSHPTLAENADAWIQRGRVQFLLYDWTAALAAVDRSLTLMQPRAKDEEVAPRVKRQNDFRARVLEFQPKR